MKKLTGVKIKKILNTLLKKSQAPVTKRHIGCMIETFNHNFYFGYNKERKSPVEFFHAEQMALSFLKRNKDISGIENIYLGGTGMEKMKQITPCNVCWKSLQPHLIEKSTITVYEPKLKNFMKFTKKELQNAYKPLTFSYIGGTSIKVIKKNLIKKTSLKNEDINFIAELKIFGLKKHIHFYLVGTSSGRGAISQLIKKKKKEDYDDIDIIAISNKPKKGIELLVRTFITAFFPDVKMHCRKFIMYITKEPNEVFEYYQGTHKKIELSIGKSKKKTFLRKDYLHNNWFHQLS